MTQNRSNLWVLRRLRGQCQGTHYENIILQPYVAKLSTPWPVFKVSQKHFLAQDLDAKSMPCVTRAVRTPKGRVGDSVLFETTSYHAVFEMTTMPPSTITCWVV